MESTHFKTTIIFGGGGFIGTYLTRHLLEQNIVEKIILADMVEPKESFDHSKISFVKVDVRKEIKSTAFTDSPNLIINLAAVHREPGHRPEEYFETNIPGAENISKFAESTGCKTIIFTSSISPYGATEEQKERDEDTLPTPKTPYGISKLAAEKIHTTWQQQSNDRSLLIVRPGVIFGHGENGNVTRMIRAMLGRYFMYVDNQDTRKAGGYVKELCQSISWMMRWMHRNNKNFALYNFTMDPPPTVKEYVEAINTVSNKNTFVPNLPFSLLLLGSYFAQGLSSLFKINQPINPTRVRKLVRSNYILPKVLRGSGYKYHYTLEEALSDWKNEYPQDFR
jgi:nucleoside-diphosphate-sugar epimerase